MAEQAESSGEHDAEQLQLTRFGFDDPEETWIDRLRAAEDRGPLGRIGSIEVLEEIGRGGQGIVYRAHQPGIGRPIAIKKLRSGLLASLHVQRRFEREVEIVSALNHPNIVRLFGLEVTDAQPVLAMEWVDGVPIHQWAEKVRNSGENALQTMLGVFRRVCAAVKYAHERGVMHRDLKPSNILIDQDNEPHIVDFGLAKSFNNAASVVQCADITVESQFLGTPAYASPEQIEGRSDEVDTRTDVYSLGVLLYEILCGERPYDLGQSWTDAIRRIEHIEPLPLASRTFLGVDRDLEAIVMKALRRKADDRYQTVDAFLADLLHYERGEAVTARPPTLVYQARKLLRRHRVAVGFSAAMLALVLGAAGVVTVLSVRAAQIEVRLRHEADLQRDNARTLYQRTEAARAEAQNAADKAGEIHRFFDWLLTSVTPQSGKGPNVTVRDVLDGADRYIATYLADQPEAEASIRETIASTYASLGLFQNAVRHARIALDIRTRLYGENHRLTALSKGNLAAAFIFTNQFDEAERLEREAVAYFRDHVEEDWSRATHEIHTLAELLRRQRRYEEAELLLMEAHRILTKYSTPDDPMDIQALNGLGAVYYDQRKFQEAADVFEELLARARRQSDVNNHQVPITTILNNLAGARMGLGDLQGAEEIMREVLDIVRQTAGPEHPSTVRYTANLAQLLARAGKNQESEELFRQVTPLMERAFGTKNADTSAYYEYYADVLVALDKPEEAITYYQKSLESLPDGTDVRSSEMRRFMDRYTTFLVKQHRDVQARELLEQVYGDSIPEELSPPDSPRH